MTNLDAKIAAAENRRDREARTISDLKARQRKAQRAKVAAEERAIGKAVRTAFADGEDAAVAVVRALYADQAQEETSAPVPQIGDMGSADSDCPAVTDPVTAPAQFRPYPAAHNAVTP